MGFITILAYTSSFMRSRFLYLPCKPFHNSDDYSFLIVLKLISEDNVIEIQKNAVITLFDHGTMFAVDLPNRPYCFGSLLEEIQWWWWKNHKWIHFTCTLLCSRNSFWALSSTGYQAYTNGVIDLNFINQANTGQKLDMLRLDFTLSIFHWLQ